MNHILPMNKTLWNTSILTHTDLNLYLADEKCYTVRV